MSLQVWLTGNNNTVNQGLDGSVVLSGTAKYLDGKVCGKGFDMSSRLTATSNAMNGAKVWSVCFWFKTLSNSSLTTNWCDLFGMTDISTSGTTGQFRFEACYGDYLRACSWHNNATNATVAGSVTIAQNKDEWHHACVTVDSTAVKTYCDGVIIGTHTSSLGGGHLNGYFWIGETNSINGCIQDIRIYDHCLSPKEVKEISKGLVLHYKLNGSGLYNPNLMVNTGFIGNFLTGNSSKTGWASLPYSEVSTTITNSGVNSIHRYRTGTTETAWSELSYYQRDNTTLVAGKTYTFSVWVYAENDDWLSTSTNTFSSTIRVYDSSGTKIGELGALNLKPTKAGIWEKRSVTFTVPFSYTNYAWWYRYFTIPRDVDVYFSQPKLEEGSVATPWCPNSYDALYSALGYGSNVEYDCSGFGYNGTKTGIITLSNDTPRYNACYKFNSSKITSGNGSVSCQGLSEATLSAWVYQEQRTSDRSCIIIGGFYLTIDSSGHLSGYAYGKNPAGYHTGTGIVPLNTWSHILVKWDDSYIYGYINGVEDFKVSSTGTFANSQTVQIGMEGSSRTLIGKISDARIYSTALSAEDIKELYNIGASIDNQGNLFCGEVVE